jgi:hypothetical protein
LLRIAMKILSRGATGRQIGLREERREDDASMPPCGEGPFSDQPAGVSFHHGYFLFGGKKRECITAVWLQRYFSAHCQAAPPRLS